MSNGRVIFVGIHNKQGLKPLDSSSPSGKKIDAVISRLSQYECVKTNLFDVDELPDTKYDRHTLAVEWGKKYNPTERDVVVALGSMVSDYLPSHKGKTVYFQHPSPLNRNSSANTYVETLFRNILNPLTNDPDQ